MHAKLKTLSKMVLASACGLLILPAGGCAVANSTHKQDMAMAAQRWQSVRSASMLGVAQQQFDAGDIEIAESTLLKSLSEDPKNPYLYVLAGRIALERDELERAFDRFKTALSFKNDCPEACYYQGIVLQRWQRYDAAYENYEQAYKLVPDNPGFLMAMAEMLVAMDKRQEARELLESKLTYFDQNAGLRAALGELYAVDHQYDKAVEFLAAAAVIRPTDLQITETLATAQLAAGKTEDAIRNLDRLTKEPSLVTRRDLQFSLGLAYVQAGQVSDARASFLKLIRTDAHDDRAWVQLAGLALADNDLSGALSAAQRVMALAPKKPDGYLVAGLVWQKRARYEQSIMFFDRAAALDPKSAEPVILRGIALEATGRADAAAAAYTEALQRRPDDRRAQELLARLGKPGQAHD